MAKKENKRGIKKDISILINDLFDVSGTKGYKKFLFFLIMIDLTWFASVVSDNLLGMNLQDYGEFAWILLFSLGMIIISDVKKMTSIKRRGFRSDNFASLVTFIIGVMAFVVAVLSLPQINMTSPVMSSIKGILALIAIIYVILEGLIIKSE